MTKSINIYGEYVDEPFGGDEISPSAFRDQIDGMKDGDDLTIHVNSAGGSVTAGIAVANAIRDLGKRGVKTTCVVDGVCASIATLTAMAADELVMFPQSFLMIHNPWTMTAGDAEQLRRDAATLDAMRSVILSYYHLRFDATDEQLGEWMDAETWISGADAAKYGLRCTVEEGREDFKMCAKLRETITARFHNSPFTQEKKMDESEEQKPVEETAAPEVEKTEEEKLREENEALKARIAELEAEKDQTVEDRVSGMQSKMQAQINASKKEFTDKLTALQGELATAKAEATRLTDELNTAKGELQSAASALAEKTNALAALNANVLKPGEAPKVLTKAEARAKLATLPLAERKAFYVTNREVID